MELVITVMYQRMDLSATSNRRLNTYEDTRQRYNHGRKSRGEYTGGNKFCEDLEWGTPMRIVPPDFQKNTAQNRIHQSMPFQPQNSFFFWGEG